MKNEDRKRAIEDATGVLDSCICDLATSLHFDTIGEVKKEVEEAVSKLRFEVYDQLIDGEESKEVWRDILDYEGHYMASDFGRIKSLKKGGSLILKPGGSSDGYLVVVLVKVGKRKTKRVHRLVAETFLKKIIGKNEVNHINEIKTDNSLINLEWCTRKENMGHGDLGKRISASLKNNKNTSKQIIQRLSCGIEKEWPSFSEAIRNGYSYNGIKKSIDKKLEYSGSTWRMK